MQIELTFSEYMRIFILFGAGFTALLGLAQLFIRKKHIRNWIFFYFYVGMTLVQITNANVGDDLHYVLPHLSLTEMPVLFLIGPTILYLFEVARKQEHEFNLLHFVVPLLSILALIPYFVEPAIYKHNRLLNIFVHQDFGYPEVLYGVGLGYSILYVGYVVFSLRRVWTWEIIQTEVVALQVLALLVIAILVLGLCFIGMVALKFTWLRWGTFMVSIMACAMFVIGHRYPSFFQAFTLVVHQTKYEKAQLKNEDANKLAVGLRELMDIEKVFLDEELTLSKLAERLGTSPHHVSQYLNLHEKKNFASFVNGYRIEEALNILKASDANVLSVAYTVGFNSKSSFSRAFQKHTGLTAKQFRERRKS